MEKKKFIVLVIGAAALFSSCQRNEFSDAQNGEVLAFDALVASPSSSEIVKSSGILAQGDGINLKLVETVTDSHPGENVKGTLYNTDGVVKELSDYVQEFYISGFNADKTSTFIPQGTKVEYGNGKWVMESAPSWTNAGHKYLFAYAHLTDGQTTECSVSDDVLRQTYQYTVPANATEQIDILMGYFEGRGRLSTDGSTRFAKLTFNHPLTSVIFKVDRLNGVKSIDRIAIDGVYSSGTMTHTGTFDGNTDPVSYFVWEGGETFETYQTISGCSLEKGSTIGEPFILIPQNIGENNVTIKIDVTLDDNSPKTLTTTLKQYSWDWGKTHIYSISNADLPISEELSELVAPHAKSFTINAQGDKVYFSRGNLQFRAKVNGESWPAAGSDDAEMRARHWRFAENQWDYVGNTAPADVTKSFTFGNVYETIGEVTTKCDNTKAAETYEGWIDLFGWGNTGYNYRNLSTASSYQPAYQPWGWHKTASYHGPVSTDLSIDEGSDWGACMAGNWFSLSAQEWDYLLGMKDNTSYPIGNTSRHNAQQKKGFATIVIDPQSYPATVTGLVILPDDFDFPEGENELWKPLDDEDLANYLYLSVDTKASYYNSTLYSSSYFVDITNTKNISGNYYTFDRWKAMEDNGAVFIPTAGCKSSSQTSYSNANGDAYGYIWTRSFKDATYAYNVIFGYFGKKQSHIFINQASRNYNYSVRLVTPAN